MKKMAYDQYRTGDLRDGYEISYDGFRPYNPVDGLIGLRDGKQLGDVIGSFTGPLKAVVKGDRVYFKATNDVSMQSFAGSNLLPFQKHLVENPKSGPLSTVEMTVEWVRPIPAYLRPKR